MSLISKHPICELKAIYKEIDGTLILNNVNFIVKKGRVTALLGPNGAGKTSSIRILLGLLEPSSGEVFLFQETIDRDAIPGRVSLLGQTNAGYKQLTTRENLELHWHGSSKGGGYAGGGWFYYINGNSETRRRFGSGDSEEDDPVRRYCQKSWMKV